MSDSPKYIFFGTPRFAEIVLQGLIDAGMPPIALVANPDRPVGRKKIITKPPTKLLAEKNNIPIFQPEKLDASFVDSLEKLAPDFFIVAAYAKIIPKTILDIPRLDAIGVHPSLLPKYRGASPIQSAILAGETETGVTIYLMDEKTDHGPILEQGTREMEQGIDYLELEEGLAKLGANLAIKTIPDFVAGKIEPRPQDESQATFTNKFKTEDGFIDEKDLEAAEQGDAERDDGKKADEIAIKILRKINALNPEPGAWTLKDGKRIKLLKAKLDGGRLVLLETQKEGEKAKMRR